MSHTIVCYVLHQHACTYDVSTGTYCYMNMIAATLPGDIYFYALMQCRGFTRENVKVHTHHCHYCSAVTDCHAGRPIGIHVVMKCTLILQGAVPDSACHMPHLPGTTSRCIHITICYSAMTDCLWVHAMAQNSPCHPHAAAPKGSTHCTPCFPTQTTIITDTDTNLKVCMPAQEHTSCD